jgi:hypothetical protein
VARGLRRTLVADPPRRQYTSGWKSLTQRTELWRPVSPHRLRTAHSTLCDAACAFEIEGSTPAGQEPSHPAPVRARGTSDSRTPSTAAARPCGRVDLVHQLFADTSRTEHPLHRRRWTRRVKDLGRGSALVPRARVLRRARAPWPEMLFHGLCNRPVVTSTQRPPCSRAWRSRAPDQRFAQASCAARARTRRWAHAPRRRRSTVAGAFDPGWWCDVRRLHQLQPPSPPFRVDPSGPSGR